MKPTLNEQLARMQKIAGIINESQTNEGYDEFQRVDKGSKDVTAKAVYVTKVTTLTST